jgi:hypothetical protein
VKLFISYRRSDSTHAAARVRMCLQQRFGEEAVFIDRKIPPGREWDEYLREMLQQATGVVVLVGDEFVKLLRRGEAKPSDAPDPLVWEIETALKLNKPIYPVLFGSCDMPTPEQLPPAIRDFSRRQAVFAREPAFDAAMAVLVQSVGDEHDWAAPGAERGARAAATPPLTPTGLLAATLALLLVAVLVPWGLGRLIVWLADPVAGPARSGASAWWHGLRYLLTTALWGLGPYLAIWLVAGLRARARVPILNGAGLLVMANLAGLLVLGGSFLLLSTLPGWRLQPLWVFPRQPTALDYGLLAIGLVTIVLTALAVAVLEPRVRALHGAARDNGLRLMVAISAAVFVCGWWFAASLAHSLPPLADDMVVPVVGYLMLAPGLSLLVTLQQHAQQGVGLQVASWQGRALFALTIALWLATTLAVFAYGPTRLLAPDL